MCTSVDRNALITMITEILVTTIIITVIIIATITTTINTNIIISITITITNMRTTKIKRAVMITSWGTRRS